MEEFVLCNFIEITLLLGWSPVNLPRFCRPPFLKNTDGGLLLDIHTITGNTFILSIFSFQFINVKLYFWKQTKISIYISFFNSFSYQSVKTIFLKVRASLPWLPTVTLLRRTKTFTVTRQYEIAYGVPHFETKKKLAKSIQWLYIEIFKVLHKSWLQLSVQHHSDVDKDSYCKACFKSTTFVRKHNLQNSIH